MLDAHIRSFLPRCSAEVHLHLFCLFLSCCCCPPPSVRSPGSPCLGLDVEELAEDCSAVRSQLEYLQRLLLQVRDEEEGINTKVHSVQNYQFSSFAFNV